MMEMRVGQLLYVKKMISNIMLGISKHLNPTASEKFLRAFLRGRLREL